jgi:hypothetical protein
MEVVEDESVKRRERVNRREGGEETEFRKERSTDPCAWPPRLSDTTGQQQQVRGRKREHVGFISFVQYVLCVCVW